MHGAPPAGGEEPRDRLHAVTGAGAETVPATIGREARVGLIGGARQVHGEPTTFVGDVSHERTTGEPRSDFRHQSRGLNNTSRMKRLNFDSVDDNQHIFRCDLVIRDNAMGMVYVLIDGRETKMHQDSGRQTAAKRLNNS